MYFHSAGSWTWARAARLRCAPRSARAWPWTCSHGVGVPPARVAPALPFLPLPDRTYLRWRMYTAYADEAAVPPVEDVIRFARWRRETMGL